LCLVVPWRPTERAGIMARRQQGPSKAPIRPLERGASIPLFEEFDFPASPCGSRSRRSSRTPTKLLLLSPSKNWPLPEQPVEPSASDVEQEEHEAVNIEGEGAALAPSATLSPASPCKQERGAAVFVQEVLPSMPKLQHQKAEHPGQAWPLQCLCNDSGTPVGRTEARCEAWIPLLRASSCQSDGTWCGDSTASAEPVKPVKVQQLQIAKMGSNTLGAVRSETQRSKDAFRRPTSSESQHSKEAVLSPHACAWKAYQARVQRIASRCATRPSVEVADAPPSQEKLDLQSSSATALHSATAQLSAESADYPVLLGQEQDLQASGAACSLVSDGHCSSPSQAQTSRSWEAQETHVATGSDFPAKGEKHKEALARFPALLGREEEVPTPLRKRLSMNVAEEPEAPANLASQQQECGLSARDAFLARRGRIAGRRQPPLLAGEEQSGQMS